MLGRWLESLKALFSRSSENAAPLDYGSGRIEEKVTTREELDAPGGPVTACEAFGVVVEIARAYDEQARLTRVSSGPGLDEQGRTTLWTFQYQFPNRWAQAVLSVHTGPPGTKPGSPDEFLEVNVTPFPAPGSAMAKMLTEGQSGFVEQQWKVELERHAPLAENFRDSSEVFQAWINDGLSLATLGPGVRLEGMTLPLGGAVWRLSDPSSGKKNLREAPFV